MPTPFHHAMGLKKEASSHQFFIYLPALPYYTSAITDLSNNLGKMHEA